MKVDTKKLERGQVELTIELTVAEYEPFLHKAAEIISQTTSIPGFRPGKASLEVVKQRVGEGQIWQEALEPAVRSTFIKALDQEKLITVGSPQIDVIKLAPGNPVIYKVQIGLLPQVELADYKNIKLESKPIKFDQKKLEKTLSDLQKIHAKEILVDRNSQKGDKVEISFEMFQDNIPVSQGKQDKFPLVIGESTFIPGFEDQLIGLKKDQTKEFQLTFPQNYHQKNLAGKPVAFKVKMLGVYELTLPEINDELAKSLGDFKTAEELKNKIRENLETEAKNQAAQQLEEDLLDKIIEKSNFDDIPDLLINSEAKKMVEELEHNLSHQGLKFADYLNHLKKTREDLLLDFAPQAIKRVKAALATRAIAQKENITISDQEIETEIQQTLAAYGDNPEIKKQIETPAYKAYIKNILTARKTIEHLKTVMVK